MIVINYLVQRITHKTIKNCNLLQHDGALDRAAWMKREEENWFYNNWDAQRK